MLTGTLLELASTFCAKYPTSALAQRLIPVLFSSPADLRRISTAPSPLFVCATLLAIAGAALRISCYRALGEFFTLNIAIRENHRLVTHGPYAFVRHPSYPAVMATVLAVPLCAVAPGTYWAEMGLGRTSFGRVATGYWVLATLGTSMLFVRAFEEERALSKVFGEEWGAYTRRVRYRFIPGIY